MKRTNQSTEATSATSVADQLPPMSEHTATLIKALMDMEQITGIISKVMYDAYDAQEADNMLDDLNITMGAAQESVGNLIGKMLYKNICCYSTDHI
ncbi:MAG: hypothetical protein SNH73_01530 [Rikenellaceae bacterium]